MRTILRSWPGVLTLAVLGGCRDKASFARIEGVLVESQVEPRPVESGETGKLEVTRGDRERQARADMSLKKGDALVTGPDGIGVLVLAGGYRIIMDPGTELTLENPSMSFVRLGRIIVKKIGEAREALMVRTELGVAAVEGTEFVVEADRGRVVLVTVLEGQVRIYPAEGLAWRDTLTYVAGNRGRLASTHFEWLAPLSPSEADSIRQRIKRLESKAGAAIEPEDGGSAVKPAATEQSGISTDGPAGTWETSEGQIVFTAHTGRGLHGSYSPAEKGQIIGEMQGLRLVGHWIESNSGQRCDSTLEGSNYWGRLTFTFRPDWREFTGQWSYCNGEPDHPWTGTRGTQLADSGRGQPR